MGPRQRPRDACCAGDTRMAVRPANRRPSTDRSSQRPTESVNGRNVNVTSNAESSTVESRSSSIPALQPARRSSRCSHHGSARSQQRVNPEECCSLRPTSQPGRRFITTCTRSETSRLIPPATRTQPHLSRVPPKRPVARVPAWKRDLVPALLPTPPTPWP